MIKISEAHNLNPKDFVEMKPKLNDKYKCVILESTADLGNSYIKTKFKSIWSNND